VDRKKSRLRRATETRQKIRRLGVYRLSVHRTPKHIYAQVHTSDGSKVLVCASTLEASIRAALTSTGNVEAARAIGKAIAEKAINAGINKVAFDRSGFKYHGRVKALAEAARERGLLF
jgi:large subunit ribosomal protein L18